MGLVIVSGLSGAGKSVAMHALEDNGFYCVDNLPVRLLDAFVDDTSVSQRLTAVSLDARTPQAVLGDVPAKLEAIRAKGLLREVLFFDAVDDVLIKRFSETRRTHPLTGPDRTLPEAIALERKLLEGMREQADSVIDTTLINVHQLRDLIRLRVDRTSEQRLTLLFESFGFKHGLPNGADLVFDVRCLPNPFWEPSLRGLTGRDLEVREFLERQPLVEEMVSSIKAYLEQWVPRFEADNRAYLTVNIGCTGGQHRSVYIVEKLAELFRESRDDVIARHRELR